MRALRGAAKLGLVQLLDANQEQQEWHAAEVSQLKEAIRVQEQAHASEVKEIVLSFKKKTMKKSLSEASSEATKRLRRAVGRWEARWTMSELGVEVLRAI